MSDENANSQTIRRLAAALGQTAPLELTERVCTWTISPCDRLRLAAALVLAEPIEALGATSCIETLARDPVVEVRRAAAVAARTRLGRDPIRCHAVLVALSRDRDRAVASAAREALMAAPL